MLVGLPNDSTGGAEMQFTTREGRRILAVTLGLSVTLGACSDSVAPVSKSDAPVSSPNLSVSLGKKLIPNQYIVVFKQGVAGSAVRGKAKTLLAQVDANEPATAGGMELGFVYTSGIKGFSAKMSAEQAALVATDPNVEYVEQDKLASIADVQSSAPWASIALIRATCPSTAAIRTRLLAPECMYTSSTPVSARLTRSSVVV
jgi:hypothetical protein